MFMLRSIREGESPVPLSPFVLSATAAERHYMYTAARFLSLVFALS